MRLKRIVLLVISLLLSISLFSCGGGDGSSAPPPPPLIEALLFSFPTGSVPSNFQNALVSVKGSSNGPSITTATVVMNNVTLTYNAAPTHQQYEGNVVVMPGGSVTLSVTVGGSTYTASGTQFKIYPTITAPLPEASFYASSSNLVTWTQGAPLTTAAYLLGVLDAADPIGSPAYFHPLPITETSFSIPLGSLSLMTGSRIVIVGITTPVLIPNAAADSFFVFGGFNYVPITVYE